MMYPFLPATGTPTGKWDVLSGDLERDRRNVRLLLETVAELAGPVEPEDRMRRAVDRALQLTEAERGLLLTEQGGVLRPVVARTAAGRDLPPHTRYSQTLVDRVWRTGQPVCQRCEPELWTVSESVRTLRLESVLAARLEVEGRRLGVLYLDATWNRRRFTQAEFRVFLGLGGLVAAALDAARLEIESRERCRMQTQIALARKVQTRLLPRDIPAPVGWDLAGRGRACHDLSGDYYDVIPLPDGRFVLVVGDVSGHGVPAALHTAAVRAYLRRLVGEGLSPEAALGSLDEFLLHDLSDAEFMTLFVGTLDPSSGSLCHASAGHPPALLCHAGEGTAELGATGLPLHAMPGSGYGLQGPTRLRTGDALLLYTDGLTEARDAVGGLWGEERLAASFERHVRAGRDAQGILDHIFAELDAWRGEEPIRDDITCLVVRAV